MTSRTFDARLGSDGGVTGTAAGDERCSEAAGAARLGGAWSAWLSGTMQAVDRIADVGPWERLDGTIVFENKFELAHGYSPHAPVMLNERAQPQAAVPVWTGTDPGGTADDCSCDGWSAFAPDGGSFGSPLSVDRAGWTHSGVQGCYQQGALYCFEL